LGDLGRALLFALAARDEVSAVHCQNVAGHVLRLAEAWGLGESERYLYSQAALLHDVGKIGISDRLLKSAEQYTEAEWTEMKQHVRIGGVLLRSLGFADAVVEGAIYHHERYDGRGYLAGLAGEKIPLVARMIAVADAFDALTSYRRYRRSVEPGRALEVMAASNGQFDPQVLECFLSLWTVKLII